MTMVKDQSYDGTLIREEVLIFRPSSLISSALDDCGRQELSAETAPTVSSKSSESNIVQQVKNLSEEVRSNPTIPEMVDLDSQGLQDEIQDVLRHLSVPDLVEHLKAIRLHSTDINIPQTIILDDDMLEEDLKSLVSRVTLPEELCLRTLRNRIRMECQRRRRNQTLIQDDEKSFTYTSWKPLQPESRGPDEGDTRPDRVRDMYICLRIGGKVEEGRYSGGIIRGRAYGKGIVRFQNGGIYIGEMKNGRIHGAGTLKMNDTVLRGDFERNRFVI